VVEAWRPLAFDNRPVAEILCWSSLIKAGLRPKRDSSAQTHPKPPGIKTIARPIRRAMVAFSDVEAVFALSVRSP
jgi:hypothetical protein